MALVLFALPAFADETLLQVSNAEGAVVEFDRQALESLPQVSIKTSTLWTQGVIEFRGPLLLDVLHSAGITSGRVAFQALNDYRLEADLTEFTQEWPIIATRRDGLPFGVRDNGPLWVIYPFDRGGKLAEERTYFSSVWQLVSITVLP